MSLAVLYFSVFSDIILKESLEGIWAGSSWENELFGWGGESEGFFEFGCFVECVDLIDDHGA